MKILVCGGRKYRDKWNVFRALDYLHKERYITMIIEGGATGADRLARNWAISRGVDYHTEKADWDQYGKSAGPLRNAKMLTLGPDGVVSFPGNDGTRDMIRQSRKANVPVWIPYEFKSE